MQGFNRYYPPDYDPKDRHHRGNLNRLAGKAAQRPVVRFEMPFNVWCLQCDAHIAQGVRFNAQKSKTGNYLSSPIFSFSMKCHLCAGAIVIATNPKDTCYVVVSGAKKKAEDWNAQETGTFQFDLTSGIEAQNPLYKLEKDATQKASLQDSQNHVTQLLQENERQWKDAYTQSQRLRHSFRSQKKVLDEAARTRTEIQERHGLGLPILDQVNSDRLTAKRVEFGRVSSDSVSGSLLSRTTRAKMLNNHDAFEKPITGVSRSKRVKASISGLQHESAESRTTLVEYNSATDCEQDSDG